MSKPDVNVRSVPVWGTAEQPMLSPASGEGALWLSCSGRAQRRTRELGPDETGGGEIHNSPRKGRDRTELPGWGEGFIPKR